MAAFQKFHPFTEHVAEKVHDLGADVLKIMLVNSPAPANANGVRADLTEIAAGFGYVAGGPAVTVTGSAQVAGEYKLVGNDVIIAAAGGSIGPFRYAVLYNDTPAAPADPLIGFWDYGASITLLDGEVLTVDLDQAAGILTIT